MIEIKLNINYRHKGNWLPLPKKMKMHILDLVSLSQEIEDFSRYLDAKFGKEPSHYMYEGLSICLKEYDSTINYLDNQIRNYYLKKSQDNLPNLVKDTFIHNDLRQTSAFQTETASIEELPRYISTDRFVEEKEIVVRHYRVPNFFEAFYSNLDFFVKVSEEILQQQYEGIE